MLLTFPDVLSPDEVAQAHKLLQTVAWADGKAGAGEQARQVKNNQQLPHDSVAARAIAAMVLAGLDRCPGFFSAALPKRIFPPSLNRYSGDTNAYGNHIDF